MYSACPLLKMTVLLQLVIITIRSSETYEMKNHIKMGPYTSLATLCLAQENYFEHTRKMKNRKVYKAKK